MKTRSRRLGPLTLMSGALVMAVACSASASPSPSSPTGASPTPPAATEGPASPPVLTPSPGPSEASVPRWEAAGNSGEFLLSHAIALSSGRVVVLGEGPYSDGFQAPTSGQVWDPATGAWTAIDDLKHRSAFAAAALADDRVLVVGGLNDENPRQSYSSAHIYDARPGHEGWTKTAIMATARTGPSAATLPGGRVLVAGGYFHAPEHGEAPDAVLAAYHPAEDDDEPSFDAPLFDADMGSGGAALATAEVFDPATDRWTTTGPMNYARYGAPAIALADGRVLIVGSLSASEGYVIQVDPRAFETAEIYDPATGRFTLAGELPEIDRAAIDAQAGASRMRMPTGGGEVLNVGSLVALPDGGAVLIGQTEWWKHEAEVTRSFRFDAASGSWSEIGEAWAYVEDHGEGERSPLVTPGVRNVAGALAAGLPDGRVLVAGGGGDSPDGFGGRHALDIAELYDPPTDTWVALPPMPVGRSRGVAATLTDGSILLAGGLADPDEYVLQSDAVRLVP